MTSNLQKLEAALALWEAADPVAPSAHPLAADLLACAELTLHDPPDPEAARDTWHRFLDVSRRTPFLLALPDAESRSRWAEVCFDVIRRSDFDLEALFAQRVARHPDRSLFRHADALVGTDWSYLQVFRQAQRFAAVLLRTRPDTPHVALWLANSIQGACCDLACLTFDIPDTPVSVHADDEELLAILDAVGFDVVVTDSLDRYARLIALRRQTNRPFTILRLDAASDPLEEGDDRLLRLQADLGADAIEEALSARHRRGLDEMSTVMFTPGPQGVPKGVVFTQYNMITKRFARAAALPHIGEEEVLLCYLPLFHTFGRFLEMMGALFWGGTYVFVSDPSIESLLAGLRTVRPTSLVSIPLRWSQIHRRIHSEAGPHADEQELARACARVTGGRLRWGLSAAGYLAPDVFRFFHRMGVALCSGFGMTEATGGVTMTPPHDYVDNSVGIPLPGMQVRLSDASELLIRAPYVARPLDAPEGDDAQRWTPTGDLFRVRHDGHFEIFDKLKDIYKNTRGQTIAPRRVEQQFDGVPEVGHAMLVGDGRDDNTLLVFPKRGAPALEELDEAGVRAFFRRRVLQANRNLTAYERVVDFAVVPEPLGAEALRDDGTLHRKAVLSRHRTAVDAMYAQRARVFRFASVEVRVPRWLFRELGVLLDDLVAKDGALFDRTSNKRLRIQCVAERYVRVGDLNYHVGDGVLDLGRVTRQPALWLGNAGLTGFFPCKEGWDVAVGGVDVCPCLPSTDLPRLDEVEPLPAGYAVRLRDAHRLTVLASAGDGPLAASAVERLGELIAHGHDRLNQVIVRRLRALADHPHAAVRSRAFRALLAYAPASDAAASILAFLHSGRSFLSEDTLGYVAGHRVQRTPLEALRAALEAWRRDQRGPVATSVREQMEQIFELLVHVSRRDLRTWAAVREELAAFSLLPGDPDLAAAADACLARLHGPVGRSERSKPVRVGWQEATPTLTPQLGAHPSDEQLQDALADPAFLARSAAVLYASSPGPFRSAAGFVVSREPAPNLAAVRVGWSGESVHADLVLTALREDRNATTNAKWRLALHAARSPWPLVPRMGLWHDRFDVVSTEMVDAPSVWDRIRTCAASPEGSSEEKGTLRALFVRCMAAYFRVWAATGRARIPRNAGPANVLMRLPDLAEHGCVREVEIGERDADLAGLVDAFDRELYERTARHYPWCRETLSRTWLFDACVEALGVAEAEPCIEAFARGADANPWIREARRYLAQDGALQMVPLAAQSARASYLRWLEETPRASIRARAQTLVALCRLHGIERFSDLVRFRLFRDTVFAQQPDATRSAFDALLEAITCRDCKATDLVQLTELQSTISSQELREVLRALVFPDAQSTARSEDTTSSVELAHDAKRKQSVRLSRRPRDISSVLHHAWTSGVPRSYWSDELAAVVVDDRGRALGGALVRRGGRDDLLFDGPYLGVHARGSGLDIMLVEALVTHAQATRAPVIRSVGRRPAWGGAAWETTTDWGGYVAWPPA